MLETDRLVLRRMVLEDADFMLKLLNEPSFRLFIGDRGVRTEDDARAYISSGPINSYERFGFGLYLTELKTDGRPIGICGLLKRESLEDADIGFALLPEFWSNGYASESARAVMAYARDTLGLDRVVAVTTPDNHGSIRVLEKLGMKFERTARLVEGGPELELYARDF